MTRVSCWSVRTGPSWFLGMLFGLAAVAVIPAEAAELVLRKGDHIGVIGNTLADRMQHDGWFETLLQAAYPEHELVLRELGFSGDELTIRLRSRDFGTPEQWLTRCEADIVIAMFGYNESFAGEAGLEKFKQDLAQFIKQTLEQQFNGEGPPRLVLVSPIAHENLERADLPDGTANNARLALYTAAMAEVAAAHSLPFVDLFRVTTGLYASVAEPLTINGVHLNERGNRLVGQALMEALFPEAPAVTEERLAAVRKAVLEKNFYWFNRYRTTDGYSIYGGRADLKFTNGQSNREVMQREMEILDAMTANRDRVIWAAARGQQQAADDSTTPEFIPVISNKPGPGPNGEHLFLSGEAAIAKMTVHEGMQVNLFASEEMFPELVNPVQMAFDTRGRLWVAAWRTYPHWKPNEPMNDKLLILEDTDGDGRADRCKTFADDLHNPTGFEFWGGGVLVAVAPDLFFLKDTDGDDVADVRVRVLHGLDSADTHHASNSFVLDPGGALYFQEGTFHHTQVETPWGPPQRCANGGVFRYEPRSHKFDVYVSTGFANPHGHIFDKWGQEIVHDGTGAVPFDGALFSGYVEFPRKHPKPPQVYNQRTRPCPATEILSSSHFPESFQGNLLVGNVIGFQGILQYRRADQGGSQTASELPPILSSSDPNFRPVDLEMGPDGALYFTDWQNPIIGHMQHNLRDPNRDQTHGRVYRVSYAGRPLRQAPKIAGAPIPELLDLLKDQDDRVRYRAKIELSGRDATEVMRGLDPWIASLDSTAPDYEHQMMEALWLHQVMNVVDEPLLKRMLASPEGHARAAATRVLCYWRDRIEDPLAMLKTLAADPHPRVRVEAVRAASFFTDPTAVEVPLISADYPTSPYLDFVRDETMKTLEPYWKAALSSGTPIAVTSDAGARFLMKNVGTEELLKMKRNRGVFLELLFRPGLTDAYRQEAVTGLAGLENKAELQVILGAIENLDEKEQGASIVFDLVRLLTGRRPAELAASRSVFVDMATKAKLPLVRQIGFVALITADGDVQPAWEVALGSKSRLLDLVTAMPLVPDPNLLAALYPHVAPLLQGLPAPLASSAAAGKGSLGRFVRIELPGPKRTLTLAEVEVFSDGRNVARSGKATQNATSHGGNAERAIDGNKNPSFSGGGQTHTPENQADPWWEVDLGDELPIDSIVVYNRNEEQLGSRLGGFTLKILAADRSEVFSQAGIPAPQVKVDLAVDQGGAEAQIRRAAMLAMTAVRGQEAPTFEALAKFVRDGIDRGTAIRAMQRIPNRYWPPTAAGPLVESLLLYIEKIPTEQRTSTASLEALQFATTLAALLPADQAKAARARIGELGVVVLRVGTRPNRMAFDVERLAVKAGKPVEFLFENSDIMPHNFVITMPGALEEVGLLGEATASQPDVLQRQFVPKSNKILLASKLLQPRQVEKLSFTAPSEPGVYPFVCTYPGHWRRMYGALYVVEDLDAYLAAPESYLADHPLPIRDELLKFNRPRTEWKLDDLASSVNELSARSFPAAKQIFQVANCAACHKLNGVGYEIGPDLTKLDPKWTATDVLVHMLEPSKKIDEKYTSYILELTSGKVVTGMVLEETPDQIKLIENPLAKNEPIVIRKSEIDLRTKSPNSIMPQGLLDKLTRDEILDLVAYVVAGGKEQHKLFHAGDHHHE